MFASLRPAATAISVLAAFAIGGTAASAATFTGGFGVTFNATDPGLVVSVAPSSNSGSLDIDLGQSVTFNIFDIWTSETAVNNDDLSAKPISVDFTLASPSAGSTAVSGSTVGTKVLGGLFQNGVLTWNAPQILSFGTTGQLLIELSDAIFNWGIFGLNEGPKHGADVYAKVTYLTADTIVDTPPAPVPLPAAACGLMAGLGALGLLRRRTT